MAIDDESDYGDDGGDVDDADYFYHCDGNDVHVGGSKDADVRVDVDVHCAGHGGGHDGITECSG